MAGFNKAKSYWRPAALAAATILPIWLFIAYLTYTAFDNGRRDIEESLATAARVQMRSAEREFAAMEAALGALSTSPSLDRGDFAAFQAQAMEVLARSPAFNIVLLGPTGAQVINTLKPYGQPLPSRPEGWFERVRTGGKTILTDLFVGPVTGQPLIALVVPVPRQGRVAMALTMSLDSRHLIPLIREEGFPSEWNGAMLDSGGTIVARVREPEKYVGQKASPTVLAAIAKAPHGIVTVESLEGTDILAAYSRSERFGWTFIVAVPRQIVEARVNRALLLSVAGGAGLLALTLLSAWLLWRSYLQTERARERGRLLLQNASDGLHILDKDGAVIDASESFCRMLGRDRDEVIGMNIADIDVALSPRAIAEAIARLFEKGEPEAFETVHRRKDGADVIVEVVCRALPLADESVLLCSSRDITRRKAAEADLKKANEDLEQFAYVSSHDLQTPLRNIISYTQLLERRYKGRLDADADDFIGFIVDHSKKMMRLITDLLEYSRASGGAKPLRPVEAGAAFDQAVANLAAVIEESGAVIVAADGLPQVMAEQSLLVSLFQNLLHNGIRYRSSDRTARLTVSATRIDRDFWRFAVADNGIGIESQYADKIFEIFQRLAPAAHPEGTGIGLSLCRRIVQRFGGTIWVSAVPGEGATFFFTLRAAHGE